MQAALIAIGSELLQSGRRDTNGDWLADRLRRQGIRVALRLLVGDDAEAIAEAVRLSSKRCELVLLTGGLGPTEDDRTREGLAAALDLPLERDEEIVRHLRRLFESYGRRWRSMQSRQALRPRGARWLENRRGTAPGLWIGSGDRIVCALPGVPAEMKPMYERDVEPALAAEGSGGLLYRVLKIAGRVEPSVDEQVRDLYDAEGCEVTILSGREGIELHLSATGADAAQARRRLEALERRFVERLGDDLYGRDSETLPERVGELLGQRGATLATAESCTAGLLGAVLTRVPGSSAWYVGGFVVYSDEMKSRLAGVPPDLIARHGAVSEEVARALAEGARTRCGTTFGIGITGIAGPGGGSAEKPVGLVHLALADAQGCEHWRLRQFGDRHLVRRRTVSAALDRLRRRLLAAGGAP